MDTQKTQDEHTSLEALQVVAKRFFPQGEPVEPLTADSDLGRVDVGEEAWCIRRWPDGTAIERMALVHQALHAARAADIVVVPEVMEAVDGTLADHPSIVAYESGLFDAESWMPGREVARASTVSTGRSDRVNLPADVPDSLVLESVRWIARFHAATVDLASSSEQRSLTPREFGRISNRSWHSLQPRLDPLAPRLLPVRRWRAAARRIVRQALSVVDEVEGDAQASGVVIHGNLWPAHVLAARHHESLKVTGFVDWRDATAGSPLVDIAHLITHFGGWTPDRAESVLAAYHDVHPLRPAERRLLPAVAALDLVAQIGGLLHAGYLDAGSLESGQRSAIRAGADVLIQSLETLANVVEFGETSPPKQFRKWIHRTPSESKPRRRPGGKRR